MKEKIMTSSNAASQEQEQRISAESAKVESVDNNKFWSYHDKMRDQQLSKEGPHETSAATDIEISQYLSCPVSPSSVNPFE